MSRRLNQSSFTVERFMKATDCSQEEAKIFKDECINMFVRQLDERRWDVGEGVATLFRTHVLLKSLPEDVHEEMKSYLRFIASRVITGRLSGTVLGKRTYPEDDQINLVKSQLEGTTFLGKTAARRAIREKINQICFDGKGLATQRMIDRFCASEEEFLAALLPEDSPGLKTLSNQDVNAAPSISSAGNTGTDNFTLQELVPDSDSQRTTAEGRRILKRKRSTKSSAVEATSAPENDASNSAATVLSTPTSQVAIETHELPPQMHSLTTIEEMHQFLNSLKPSSGTEDKDCHLSTWLIAFPTSEAQKNWVKDKDFSGAKKFKTFAKWIAPLQSLDPGQALVGLFCSLREDYIPAAGE